MEQITREQAIKIYESEIWKNWSNDEIVRIQLFQDVLIVPFKTFHKAITEVLERPVFTHEMAHPEFLIAEYLGEKPPPTFEEIVNLIPEDKRLIIGINS